MERILIMAQGEARRLPGKHLALINGEPLLYRTIRLCKETTSAEVIVVGWDTGPFASIPTMVYTQPDPGKGLLDGIWNTWPLWRGCERATILLGDVVFSRATLRACLGDWSSAFTFFGRSGPSRFTGCQYGEIFGLGLRQEGQQLVAEAIADPDVRKRRDGRLWGLWDTLAKRSASWVEINDWTDDIDYPRDLKAFQKLQPMIAKDR